MDSGYNSLVSKREEFTMAKEDDCNTTSCVREHSDFEFQVWHSI